MCNLLHVRLTSRIKIISYASRFVNGILELVFQKKEGTKAESSPLRDICLLPNRIKLQSIPVELRIITCA